MLRVYTFSRRISTSKLLVINVNWGRQKFQVLPVSGGWFSYEGENSDGMKKLKCFVFIWLNSTNSNVTFHLKLSLGIELGGFDNNLHPRPSHVPF